MGQFGIAFGVPFSRVPLHPEVLALDVAKPTQLLEKSAVIRSTAHAYFADFGRRGIDWHLRCGADASVEPACAVRAAWRFWTRRDIELVVFEVRGETANVCQQMADKCSEPPLDEQS